MEEKLGSYIIDNIVFISARMTISKDEHQMVIVQTILNAEMPFP